MDEREELAQVLYSLLIYETSYSEVPFEEAMRRPRYAHLEARVHQAKKDVAAAGWRKLPEPGSPDWAAMVKLAQKAYALKAADPGPGFSGLMDAALRAALGLDQPHRENDKRPEEQPREAG